MRLAEAEQVNGVGPRMAVVLSTIKQKVFICAVQHLYMHKSNETSCCAQDPAPDTLLPTTSCQPMLVHPYLRPLSLPAVPPSSPIIPACPESLICDQPSTLAHQSQAHQPAACSLTELTHTCHLSLGQHHTCLHTHTHTQQSKHARHVCSGWAQRMVGGLSVVMMMPRCMLAGGCCSRAAKHRFPDDFCTYRVAWICDNH